MCVFDSHSPNQSSFLVSTKKLYLTFFFFLEDVALALQMPQFKAIRQDVYDSEDSGRFNIGQY